MKKKILLALSLLFIFGAARSTPSFHEKCTDLIACIQSTSQLTGQNYLYDAEDLKGKKLEATPNTPFTKANADLLLTQFLDNAGYARVPAGKPKTYRVLHIADAVNAELPMISAGPREEPALPNTWDLMELRYKVGSIDKLGDLTHKCQEILPANAKVFSTKEEIGIIAKVPTLRRIYSILREMDHQPSKKTH